MSTTDTKKQSSAPLLAVIAVVAILVVLLLLVVALKPGQQLKTSGPTATLRPPEPRPHTGIQVLGPLIPTEEGNNIPLTVSWETDGEDALPLDSTEVYVRVQTAGDTATSGQDYVPINGDLVRIPGGQTEVTFELPTINDNVAEPTEGVLVNVDIDRFVNTDTGNVTRPDDLTGGIFSAAVYVEIYDDDENVHWKAEIYNADPLKVREGDGLDDAAILDFEVRLIDEFGAPVRANQLVNGGPQGLTVSTDNVQDNNIYIPIDEQPVTFAGDESEKQVQVFGIPNTEQNSDRTVILFLRGPGVWRGVNLAAGIIEDDDNPGPVSPPPPTILPTISPATTAPEPTP